MSQSHLRICYLFPYCVFLKLKPIKATSLFFFLFFYLIETHPMSPMNACGQTSHTWLLSVLLSHSLPRAFFSLVTGCHGFGSHCRLKTVGWETGGGLKAAILGTAGPGWSLLPLCPTPSHSGGKRGVIVWGLELPVCQLITWGGKRGRSAGGEGVSRKSEGEKMKEKMKESGYERAYDIERGKGGLYSCTLNHTHTGTDYPFHTHTHTQLWGNWNILKDFEGNKRQNKETANLRQKDTPPPDSDTPGAGTNKLKLTKSAHAGAE